MPRIALALLTGVVLLLLGLLWRERQRVEALQAQVVATETRLARAMSAETARAASKAPVENAVREQPPNRESKPAAATPAARTFTETERNFRKQINEYHRWDALAKNADLLSALKLSPEKLSALKDLLAERDYVERDARDAARAAGVEPHEAAAAEVAKIDARIRSVLGEADYASYTEQISLGVFRQQLEGTPIPGSMVDAGAPLTSEQKAWMAGVMYRSFGAQLTPQPGDALSADPDAARRAFTAALLAEAPDHLTPPQIDALRDYFRKDDELAGQIKTMLRERSQRK